MKFKNNKIAKKMVNTQNIVERAKNIIWVHIKKLIIIIIVKLVGKYNTYHEPLSIQGMDREEIQIFTSQVTSPKLYWLLQHPIFAYYQYIKA